VLAALTLTLALAADASARWRVEPATGEVEVGEPFRLVLEVEHEPGTSAAELVPGELALSDAWLLLGREEVRSVAIGARQRSLFTWSLAALEPGERALGEELAGFVLGPAVTRIQAGETRVQVRSVLAEGEDAPRPLAGFEGELGAAPEGSAFPWALVSGLALVVAVLFGWWWARRRRARARPAPLPSPEERLAELAARAAAGEGREGCYALTRFLREHTDRRRQRDRAALTDEEWLAELAGAPELPKSALDELGGVFERAARVKYAGEEPSPWALEETFAGARRALAGLAVEVRR
jgi:hypothetical protein